ncbi:hypothetical protein [Streptomyces botrytidirepellens]|uniref:hypothetical protein n=1 Tax=Streptomyces botrytidirepellens TaxID=2486417 RepID=UPI001FEBA584|nr:hypothetical protein [Streptomyces botrytidirepellens]
MSTTTPCADRLDDGTPPLISVTAAMSGEPYTSAAHSAKAAPRSMGAYARPFHRRSRSGAKACRVGVRAPGGSLAMTYGTYARCWRPSG